MVWKFVLCLFALAIVFVAADPKKIDEGDQVVNERISALYVKDDESGELRFLTGSGPAINQLITQKQNVLEQLRPPTGVGGVSNGVQPIYVDLNGGVGTTSGTTPVTTGVTGGGTLTGATGATGGAVGGGFQGAAVGASPIGDLLPQIVGQAVGNNAQNRRGVRRRGTKRRRVQRQPVNRRRPNNRRRPSRRRRPGNKKKSQVYVVRPREL